MTRRITSKVAASLIGVKTATLANWRGRNEGPTGWIRLSRTCVVYPLDEVERWLAQRAEANAKGRAAS